MILKDFLGMYDNWNGITCVNDDNLNPIVKDKTYNICEKHSELSNMEVVSFGFYDNEMTIRVK